MYDMKVFKFSLPMGTSYRVLIYNILCSVLSSVRNVFIHSDLLIYFSKYDGGSPCKKCKCHTNEQ